MAWVGTFRDEQRTLREVTALAVDHEAAFAELRAETRDGEEFMHIREA